MNDMNNNLYTCIDNEYKSKILLDIVHSNEYGAFVLYKFWNQVGNKIYSLPYKDFISKHTKRKNNEYNKS